MANINHQCTRFRWQERALKDFMIWKGLLTRDSIFLVLEIRFVSFKMKNPWSKRPALENPIALRFISVGGTQQQILHYVYSWGWGLNTSSMSIRRFLVIILSEICKETRLLNIPYTSLGVLRQKFLQNGYLMYQSLTVEI